MAKKPKRLIFKLIIIGLLLGGPGCYHVSSPEEDDDDRPTDTDYQSDIDTDVDWDTNSDSWNTDSDTLENVCKEWEYQETHTVPSLDQGLPPDKDVLCDAASDPVSSGRAVTAQIDVDPNTPQLAKGRIEIAPGIRNDIVGPPTLEIASMFPEKGTGQISNIQPSEGGFIFDLSFDTDFPLHESVSIFTIRVTLELACDTPGMGDQTVESLISVEYCSDIKHPVWVTSGNTCVVCHEVCEMAACPIPAGNEDDPLPLAGSPRVDILPLARVGRSVFLFADYRDTLGRVAFEWIASGGELSETHASGVIWELPPDPGPHLIQVVVRDSRSAQVARMHYTHSV